MNTPAHVVLNLLVVGRGRGEAWKPILLGALLPDLPILLMYVVERGLLGTPEVVIWQERYFAEGWQLFVDLFNSLPLLFVAWAGARFRGAVFLEILFLSMAVHAGGDFLTHPDDAHRHFLPLSEWRFRSPLSYWDPAHHGRFFMVAELAMLLLGSLWLVARGDRAVRRLAVGTLAISALFVAFALVVWAPLAEP
ncbi:MAG: hypothetical protein CL910_17620 [Deltaproteobacteria bacterium]|nr:hypothetical protein [Deltaproteobacteria bacterium]